MSSGLAILRATASKLSVAADFGACGAGITREKKKKNEHTQFRRSALSIVSIEGGTSVISLLL
jgi:hypothetical protein